MSRITIGQFYPVDSCIHNLDPRIKIAGTFMYITFLMFVNHFAGHGAAALLLAVVVGLSKVPPLLLFRGLRAVLFILIVVALTNLFMSGGETVLLEFWVITLTQEGIIRATQMALRLVLLISGSSVLTLTTSPIELTDGIEALLKPLKKIKVPAHDIAMMMTIALRFIPTLADEADKIIKAQKARGADFDTGGLIKKAKNLLPILIPLFISAFKRADELATAMEARCYRGDVGRTKLKQMKLRGKDAVALLVICLFGAVVFATRLL